MTLMIIDMNTTCATSYSTIAWGASLHKGREANVDYDLRATTTPGKVFGVLGGLGDVAFAYSGHNVVLEIQATIPSTPEKPSKHAMWKGALVAYIIVAMCYFPVTFVGYWAFGNSVDDNILITLSKPKWLIAAANMMVVVHVIGSYQVVYIEIHGCFQFSCHARYMKLSNCICRISSLN